MGPLQFCPSCLSAFRPWTAALAFRPALTSIKHSPNTSSQQSRWATQSANALKYRRKDEPQSKLRKKKKARANYAQPDLKNAIQFNLVDAMRYIRAAEVGRPPTSSKYELFVRIRTVRDGQVIRNRVRLPHPVRSDVRVAVICPPDSPHAETARRNGASIVGDETVFAAIKEGRIEFDRCICQTDSLPKLAAAGVARILGPRGLMPSAKTGTVVKDVGNALKDMVGASEYRERKGVVRAAVGQLGFTPEELRRNIAEFLASVRKDMNNLSDRISKDIHEVVLSSTNGPGLSLNGEFQGPDSVPTADLSTA